MKVFNLTKHPMTQGQLDDGGVNLPTAQQASNLHDFTVMPSNHDMKLRADALMQIAVDHGSAQGDGVLLAGAMYFVPVLVKAAKDRGFKPVFSFTQRVAVETTNPDDTVSLSYVFKHEGWMIAD